MNVVLIGYRGTGKSSVARHVAAATGRETYCMDDEIVRRAACSIPDFVTRFGWDAFRDLETEVAKDAGALRNVVIDAGGGVVLRPENVAALKANGRIIWLQARVETIVERIRDDTQRPSLTGAKSFVDEVVEVLAVRTPLYAAAADLTVVTDGRAVADIAEEIVTRLSANTP